MWNQCLSVRHWTRDLGVLGSISAVLVMCKKSGQALNLHHLCPPNSNGHQVEQNWHWVNGYSCRKFVLRYQKDECEKLEFQYLRVIDVKYAEPAGDIWTINIHLLPFTFVVQVIRGLLWYSGSGLDSWSTGRAIDPAPGP